MAPVKVDGRARSAFACHMKYASVMVEKEDRMKLDSVLDGPLSSSCLRCAIALSSRYTTTLCIEYRYRYLYCVSNYLCTCTLVFLLPSHCSYTDANPKRADEKKRLAMEQNQSALETSARAGKGKRTTCGKKSRGRTCNVAVMLPWERRRDRGCQWYRRR